MKILVIEDDNNKRQQLVDFFSNFEDIQILETKSYNSGLRALLEETHDLVFLDMTMPTFDRTPTEKGGRIRPFAGRDILTQLRNRGINSHIVIFTQFELLGEGSDQMSLQDLDATLKKSFPNVYRGYVHYDTAQNDWKEKISQIIRNRFEEIGR